MRIDQLYGFRHLKREVRAVISTASRIQKDIEITLDTWENWSEGSGMVNLLYIGNAGGGVDQRIGWFLRRHQPEGGKQTEICPLESKLKIIKKKSLQKKDKS